MRNPISPDVERELSVWMTRLINVASTGVRDTFLASANVRDFRREVIHLRAQAIARQLDVFANSTLYEEPELWQQ